MEKNKQCNNCGNCRGCAEILGSAFAVKKYERLVASVSWTFHSQYKTCDIWRACAIDNREKAIRGLYRAYVSPGVIMVGASLDELKSAISAYMEARA